MNEIWNGKKGNIEEAANEIITAMCDKFLKKDTAYEELLSIFEKIISERRKTIIISNFFI